MRIEDDHLIWWDSPIFNPHAGGGGSEQTFEDFMARGTALDSLSENALAELAAAVRIRVPP